MFESVIGFFLFVSNWVSPVGDVGNISIEHVERRDDTSYVELNTNYRWQEVGTKIVSSGIPLKFSYKIAIDEDDTIRYIKKLKYKSSKKKYYLSRNDRAEKQEYSNLFSALEEMKKVFFFADIKSENITIFVDVIDIRVKGVKDPIDLSEICGGGHFIIHISRKELDEISK